MHCIRGSAQSDNCSAKLSAFSHVCIFDVCLRLTDVQLRDPPLIVWLTGRQAVSSPDIMNVMVSWSYSDQAWG